jgi:signal transduction histidine kinase
VLLNLLRNSLNATARGGSISVVTAVEQETVVIAVSDNGQGIASADLPLVFEPFFTRSRTGTGLGLSITQRIVEEHNGSIEVRSDAGEGTTFTVRLPIDRGERTSA